MSLQSYFVVNSLYIRRLLRSRIPRILLVCFVLFTFLDAWRISLNIIRQDAVKPPHRPRDERIYIASMHFNDGALLAEHWNDALLDLVDTLGTDRVYVSIYESGSWDKDTKTNLATLDQELARRGVERKVETSMRTHQDEIDKAGPKDGWVKGKNGEKGLRRIPYLARLRNKTLKDLLQLSKKGVHFDKVLFLNDVVFTTNDVLTLLNTNGGEYAAACSQDFKSPPFYYDTFALRDIHGHKHASQRWPYFKAYTSRHATISHLDAVPVKSCWNGIVAMPAQPFIAQDLRFRGIPDSLAAQGLEGSECCLIHADNPLSSTSGVYLNPRVRVGYSVAAYHEIHPASQWTSTLDTLMGIWTNRFMRWFAWSFEGRWVKGVVSGWEKETGKKEVGEFCLIHETQILVKNGWRHI